MVGVKNERHAGKRKQYNTSVSTNKFATCLTAMLGTAIDMST